MSDKSFPQPQGGASLLLSFRLERKRVLIIGGGTLAASRAFAALEADSAVTVLSRNTCEEIQWRAAHKQLTLIDPDTLPEVSTPTHDRDAAAVDALLAASPDISLVCITDTILSALPAIRRSPASASAIHRACVAHRVPVNVADMPTLCDFSFTATHRFVDPDSGARTPLQISVTTNGQGCRLAGRLRREIVARLPREVGTAVDVIRRFREFAKGFEAEAAAAVGENKGEEVAEDDDSGSAPTPNEPVPPRALDETALERARHRMMWVAQVSEYWPLSGIATMTTAEMRSALEFDEGEWYGNTPSTRPSLHGLSLRHPRGRIILVGSGPGHPSLLTLAAHKALTMLADLVIADKLVPEAVLALIPKTTEVQIARKFPGNADGAQTELMNTALAAARRGLTVVRVWASNRHLRIAHRSQLKQGDPVVYGRAGEEFLFFRAAGYEPLLVPGVSAALAAPAFAGIPVTQRGVADSFVVCTGAGRGGAAVCLPGYVRARTLVVLMGVARLPQLLAALCNADAGPARDGPAYPAHLPVALIERASMADQRVLTSTLGGVADALAAAGPQRPPGLLVIGWAVLSLWGLGDMTVLDDGAEAGDAARVARWLGDEARLGWRVREGIKEGWDEL